jgi:Xaa-Pro aminopeptidase
MEFGKNNTPFEKAEFGARVAATKKRMYAAGLDALIVSDPANMNYLTGYDGWSFYVHQCVIVGQDLDEPIWIGRGQDVNGAKLTTILSPDSIIGYSDDHVQSTVKHPMQAVARHLESRGLSSKRSASRPIPITSRRAPSTCSARRSPTRASRMPAF